MAAIRFLKDTSPGYTEWSAYNEDAGEQDSMGEDMEYPVAQITMKRGSYDLGRRGTDINPDSIEANYFKKPGEQLHMFGVKPSRIEYAYADRSMRTVTPTLIGMAVNEAKKIGLGLSYSDDLSPHSSKLAKRGLDLGMVVPNEGNEKAEARNSIAEDSLGSYQYWKPEGVLNYTPEAHPDEVKAGRETIRGIARQSLAARKSHMGSQFNHSDLDQTWHQPELGQ